MRISDVYRNHVLKGCMRILENGQIEWAYCQEADNWQSFWWSNDVKFLIEDLIQEFPYRQELAVSEFKIRRRGS
jgi:hypothetical protein